MNNMKVIRPLIEFIIGKVNKLNKVVFLFHWIYSYLKLFATLMYGYGVHHHCLICFFNIIIIVIVLRFQ
jgi:hypothetical protein